MSLEPFTVAREQAGLTLAAFLRSHLPDQSWTQIRRLIDRRRVTIGSELCVDPARRLREGEAVTLLAQAAKETRLSDSVNIRFLDEHLVVVEKPSGIATVRHPTERNLSKKRKALTPTLEDIAPKLIVALESRPAKGALHRLRIVQRLDKETSGLVVFARTVAAERELGSQFRAHTVVRRYLAVVPGYLPSQRVVSMLVRDRGDGRRGSTTNPRLGKKAVTHVEVLEKLPGYTILACRLETGRTHQIRIHLAELGHPVCGEKVYNRAVAQGPQPDASGAPRLALHATELGFVHPISKAPMHWTMPLPPDLDLFLKKKRHAPLTH